MSLPAPAVVWHAASNGVVPIRINKANVIEFIFLMSMALFRVTVLALLVRSVSSRKRSNSARRMLTSFALAKPGPHFVEWPGAHRHRKTPNLTGTGGLITDQIVRHIPDRDDDGAESTAIGSRNVVPKTVTSAQPESGWFNGCCDHTGAMTSRPTALRSREPHHPPVSLRISGATTSVSDRAFSGRISARKMLSLFSHFYSAGASACPEVITEPSLR